MNTHLARAACFWILAAFGLGLARPAAAVLPEPDNVVFGALVRDGAGVTAADTDVVIEVRRAIDGPAVARYQMGSNPRLGSLYSVRVPLESLTPRADDASMQTGERVYVVATDGNGDFAATNLLVGQRGTLQRVDLGVSTVPDADGDGLPDVWERQFGLVGNGTGDADGDGVPDRMEYVAGTNPRDPNDVFRLTITPFHSQQQVSFLARRAEGPGYEGLDRIYTLESTTNLAGATWAPVSGATGVVGSGQTVQHDTAATLPALHFRASVRLQAQGGPGR